MKAITHQEIVSLAVAFKLPVSRVQAFREVESGKIGFDKATSKIIIQFEPVWFKRKVPYAPSGLWSVNKVEKQAAEWLAFNDAFRKNANGAMEATSWGSMQVMGFNYERLGFKTVGAMVDFAKESEYNQVWLGLEYIRTDPKLYQALLKGDFPTVARLYNGENYRINKYDEKLAAADKKYS